MNTRRTKRGPLQTLNLSGFTFVELLIAATMISILFVGLTTHLQGGVNVWQRATTAVEALQQRQATFMRLERDFANTVLYYSKDTPFRDQGSPAIQFADRSLQWFTVVRAPRQPGALRVISYTCGSLDGQPWLYRTSQSVSEAKVATRVPVREKLLPGCESLSVQYAFLPPTGTQPLQLQWKPVWPKNDSETIKVPRLVEVTLHLAGGRALSRVFTIPIGILEPYDVPTPPA